MLGTQNYGEPMTLILKEMKEVWGITEDNLGFDTELLMHINSAKTALIQLGVTEMDISINEEREWPTFVNSETEALVKDYMRIKVRRNFDPSASETINRTWDDYVRELTGRIVHETSGGAE